MAIDRYPFSERYGRTTDQYGLSWQIMCMGKSPIAKKNTPMLMFVGKPTGWVEEAMNFYKSIFDHSKIGGIIRYGEGNPPDKPNSIAHGHERALQEQGSEKIARVIETFLKMEKFDIEALNRTIAWYSPVLLIRFSSQVNS